MCAAPPHRYIELELPVFHIGYYKALHTTLQCVCKTCSRVLLPNEERAKYTPLAPPLFARTLQQPPVIASRHFAFLSNAAAVPKRMPSSACLTRQPVALGS